MVARYIVDENGERTGVIVSVEEYRRLTEGLEELEDAIVTRAYDRAEFELGEDESISWKQASRDRSKAGQARGPGHCITSYSRVKCNAYVRRSTG